MPLLSHDWRKVMIEIENMTILIVDDVKSMRSIIKKTLRHLNIGRKIHFAENGQSGLTILRERQVDLAIVDWKMPVMNGAEMLDAMRSDPKTRDIPVLMITAESERDVVYEVAEVEVDAYLLKPLTPVMLERKIKAVVQKANDPDEATLCVKRARVFEESGKLDLAIECQAKAVALKPRASRLMRNLGTLYGKKGLADKMEECLLEAASCNLQDAVTRHFLSKFYWEQKEWGKAVRYICEVLKLTNRYNDNAINAGKQLLVIKQNKLALTLFSKLIGKLEKQFPVKESILDLCMENGEMAFAETLLTRLLEEFPSQHGLLLKTAEVYEHLRDDDKALEYYLTADKNIINSIQAKLKIARLYFKKEKVIQADDFITQVLRLEPENKEALELRRAI